MSTPLGDVQTVTSGTISFAAAGLRTSRIEAVPATLLLTTAIPKRPETATRVGLLPTPTVVRTLPKVGLGALFTIGLMSITETVLQPLFVIIARSRVVSMATPAGFGGGVAEQLALTSMDCKTEKSVAFDCTPLPFMTSRAKRRGTVRKKGEMSTSSSLLLTNLTAPPGCCAAIDAPSRRT